MCQEGYAYFTTRISSFQARSIPTKPQTLVGPTVTITSELSPTEELGKWTPLGSSRYLGKFVGGFLVLVDKIIIRDIICIIKFYSTS